MLAYARPSISTPPSTGSVSNTSNISGTVATTATEDIDTIVLSGLCSVKYLICVFNSSEDKYCSFELHGTRKSGSSVEDTLYAKIGDPLDFTVEFVVVGSDAVLRITNNETFTITVDGVKII
jgi:hypothetical protein